MQFTGFTDEASKNIDRQIEALKTLGWTGIETRMVLVNGKSVHFDDVDDKTFEQIREKLDKAGIRIICYGSQIANWSRKVTGDFRLDTDELRRIIPRMKKTGTTLVRVMSYPNDGLGEAEYKKEVFSRMRELCKMAEDAGIILAHENCSGYGGPGYRLTLDLLNEIKSPALKLIFDTGNPIEHGLSSWIFYKAVKSEVVHMHIKDYLGGPGYPKDHLAVYPGEGDGDVLKITTDLKKSGYQGWYSMEPHIITAVHEGAKDSGDTEGMKMFLKYGRMFETLYRTA
jgi:sugar phosphate isomerase/epimerase